MNRLKGKLSAETSLKGSLTSDTNISVTLSSGARGASAYEIWLRQGNNGTEEDFLLDLKAQVANYETLENKPSIEDTILEGNKTFEEIGLTSIDYTEIKNLF